MYRILLPLPGQEKLLFQEELRKKKKKKKKTEIKQTTDFKGKMYYISLLNLFYHFFSTYSIKVSGNRRQYSKNNYFLLWCDQVFWLLKDPMVTGEVSTNVSNWDLSHFEEQYRKMLEFLAYKIECHSWITGFVILL